MADSSLAERPKKPRPDFPLFPHASGRWTKKIRGKFVYFGKVADDPDGQAAYLLWADQKDDLLAGRTPRVGSDGFTVRDLCNRFIAAKELQRDAGEITPRTYDQYYATCERLCGAFGKSRLVDDLAADDFEAFRATLAKRLNANSLGNEIQRVRVVLNYAFNAGLVDRPVRVGPHFKRPAKRLLRAERHRKGPRMFEAAELQKLIKKADQPLRAMILLGINCGFGNGDCGHLPLEAIDLKGGWIRFPRPKTSIDRRCPLWPETIKALKDAIEKRPAPKAAADDRLAFITKYGQPWAKETSDNPVSKEMRKLLDDLNMYRAGLGFYALRHTFETVAGESRDQPAVDLVMGHADESMGAVYRERISDERLRDVVGVVHKWLFSKSRKRAK